MNANRYKYQTYNKKFFYADAVITEYVRLATRLLNKKTIEMADIKFCHRFETMLNKLFANFPDKRNIWLYILSNEFPHKNKSYAQKRADLLSLGLPMARPSFYREVVLFTNIVAEYLGFGTDYVDTRKELNELTVPLPAEAKACALLSLPEM